MTNIPASTMVSRGIKLLAIIWALCFSLPLEGQWMNNLREGDLLFCCPDSANAITAVTSGVEELPIDHVGIVHRIGGEDGLLYVIEAVKPAVQLNPINSFLLENPRLLLGRVNVDVDFDRSIKHCLAMVGKPYDDLYMPGDSALYCSELVQMNYVNHHGALIFEPISMSFHDKSGQVTDYWLRFYAERGLTVPEGAPGTNPGELSRRQQVTIIAKIYHNDHDIIFQRNR